MTRGKLALLKDRSLFITSEINGDMYISENSLGQKILEEMKEIKTLNNLKKLLNKYSYNYQDHFITEFYNPKMVKELLNFNNRDHYNNFWNYTDYIFIKNNSGSTVKIKDEKEYEKNIADDSIVIIYHKKFYDPTKK